jgi:hypothetical protein
MNAIASLLILVSALGQAPSSDRSTQARGDGANETKPGATHLDPAAKSLEGLKQAASRYRITLAGDQTKDLVFVADPVLRWTNPLRRTADGATFIWIADGRPEVVGSFYRYTEGDKVVADDEFQSLATTSLTAARSGTPVWAPRAAGIGFAPIPGAPRPAATPVERLRQMRALATEFHAFIDTDNDKTEFRLLSRPLYRYLVNRSDLTDGALFAYVLTTDPEVLLMIESRPKSGTPVWHYGFARMSMINLKAKHKDRDVWSVPWATDFQNPNESYVTLPANGSPK